MLSNIVTGQKMTRQMKGTHAMFYLESEVKLLSLRTHDDFLVMQQIFSSINKV